MKKSIVLGFMISMLVSAYGQGSAGFFDDRDFFYTYGDGMISKQEILKIDTFFPSYNYLAYVDRNGNFKLIHHHKKYTINPVAPDYIKGSNFLLAYQRGSNLGIFNGKQSKTIEGFLRDSFKLGDSILAYVNTMDYLKVYVFDTTYELMNFASSDMYQVSENMVVYRTLGDRLKSFYHGNIYDIEDILPRDYIVARDMIAYHDNIGNFKIWERGNTYTLEQYEVPSYKLTNNLLTYYTNIGEWMAFSDSKKTTLLNTKPKRWLQKRNMLVYSDNAGNFYAYTKGKVVQLENYTPQKFDIWDDILVYADMYNVLWGMVNGQKIKVSDGIVIDWWMQNNCIVFYDLTPNVKSVWNNGKIYRYTVENDPSRK